MARRNKLVKFTEILTFSNVYENFDPRINVLTGQDGKEVKLKSIWAKDHFKNKNPIVLELACGGGEYSLALGQRYPEINFIGVDIKGARIWKGAKKALSEGLDNVAFLRTKIEMIEHFFSPGEISGLWIIFPDPFLKASKVNRRLSSPSFLKKYHQLLIPGSSVCLKTDSDFFYEFTKDTIQEEGHQIIMDDDNIYNKEELCHPDLDIKTHYELQHLKNGKTIKFLRFKLNY